MAFAWPAVPKSGGSLFHGIISIQTQACAPQLTLTQVPEPLQVPPVHAVPLEAGTQVPVLVWQVLQVAQVGHVCSSSKWVSSVMQGVRILLLEGSQFVCKALPW